MFCTAQTSTYLKLNYNNFLVKNKLKTSDTTFHFIPSMSLSTNVENVKPPIAEDFSTCTYGFFCREELKIEKATKMPIRFRLGSLAQCNYYEGKKQ